MCEFLLTILCHFLWELEPVNFIVSRAWNQSIFFICDLRNIFFEICAICLFIWYWFPSLCEAIQFDAEAQLFQWLSYAFWIVWKLQITFGVWLLSLAAARVFLLSSQEAKAELAVPSNVSAVSLHLLPGRPLRMLYSAD